MDLEQLRRFAATAPFNEWLALEVISAENGHVEIRLNWRDEFAQYQGYLHAGIIGGLLDTAAGFAVLSLGRKAMVSQFSANMMRPAIGDYFIAKGEVIRAGRTQIFARAELYSARDGEEKLSAAGGALLVPISG